MTKFLLLLLLTGLLLMAPAFRVAAQDDSGTTGNEYATALLENIHALDTASSPQQLNELAATFSAMYEAKKEWHPLYYQCLALTRYSKALTDASKKEGALRQVEKLLADLPENNDEVLVLKADFAMAMLGFNRDLWQQYLPMINTSLKRANAINPDNPRVYYLQGTMAYYMPAAMGGGKDAGLALLRKALEKYQAYKSRDPYGPHWGRKETEKFLAEKK